MTVLEGKIIIPDEIDNGTTERSYAFKENLHIQEFSSHTQKMLML